MEWALPILSIVLSLGYAVVFYTGFFLLIFADTIPRRQAELRPGIVVRVTAGGMVTHGYEIVSIVRRPAWAPFIEEELQQRTIKDENDCDLTYLTDHQPPGGHYSIVCHEGDGR